MVEVVAVERTIGGDIKGVSYKIVSGNGVVRRAGHDSHAPPILMKEIVPHVEFNAAIHENAHCIIFKIVVMDIPSLDLFE